MKNMRKETGNEEGEIEKPVHSKSMFIIEMKKGSKKCLRMPRNRLRTEPRTLSVGKKKYIYTSQKTEASTAKIQQGQSKESLWMLEIDA